MRSQPKKKATATLARPPVAKSTSEDAASRKLESTSDNSAKLQRFRILEALKSGPQTSYELRRMGCYQAPARVLELRAIGHSISTTRVTLIDADGYSHPGAALYTLIRPRGKKAVPQ